MVVVTVVVAAFHARCGTHRIWDRSNRCQSFCTSATLCQPHVRVQRNQVWPLKIDLNVFDQIAQPDAERSCNPYESQHTCGFLPTLHLADVNRVEPSSFSQLFLAETRMLPVLPDGVPDQLLMWRRLWHSISPKQQRQLWNTVNSPLFVLDNVQ